MVKMALSVVLINGMVSLSIPCLIGNIETFDIIIKEAWTFCSLSVEVVVTLSTPRHESKLSICIK